MVMRRCTSAATASSRSKSERRTFAYNMAASALSGVGGASLEWCSISRRRYLCDCGLHPRAPGIVISFGTRSTNADNGRRASLD
jgi:hypothetical protein